VTDIAITPLAAAQLHALEIWSNPTAVAARFKAATGFALPPMGRSAGTDALHVIRYEPTVWLVEGDVAQLAAIIANDGALTAIGGGVAKIRLSGTGWRALLMEGGVFDAENPNFTTGCRAATIINHVGVRLHVLDHNICDTFVPLSYSAALIEFWEEAAANLVD
jgi:heterotetrameric sarcosine oxidase gamma subunit